MQFSRKLQIQIQIRIQTTRDADAATRRATSPACKKMPPQKSTDAQQRQAETHTHAHTHTHSQPRHTRRRECEIMCATASDTPYARQLEAWRRRQAGAARESVWAVPRLIYDRKHVIGAATVETRKLRATPLAPALPLLARGNELNLSQLFARQRRLKMQSQLSPGGFKDSGREWSKGWALQTHLKCFGWPLNARFRA